MSGNREGVLVENKIYVLGDSHVEAYSTLLQQLSDEFGIKIVKLSQGGCGVAGLLGPTMARNKACADKIRSALSVIELTVAPGDIVFLASLRTNRFGDQWAAFSEERIVSSVSSDAAASYREQGLQEAIEIIKWLERLPVHIIIDAPKPIFKSPAFRCSDWFNNANPVCEGRLSIKRDYLLSHREPIMESLRVLADRFPF
ncbi:SGNH hydrolase domain-containing protein [Candidatus Reidiella endopervernicosa]|uniref:SGNH domain-containing protein n=1 Tax=Candidatus Reidiella endopervernicosa TaxID=2738883 RepID=A0A6N0HZ72_9GAMM|nr:SGNH hydrolase domain-containing protein [Candidatus Reidiella endopervernicosa]QKQ27663.1 hypothetical protein HUE57_16205 [Candidatus Reidiella endopervernicosa]